MSRRKKTWHWLYSHKAGSLTLWYAGKHRWRTRPSNGRTYYYNKATKWFHSSAPKGSGGLKGLKSFWKKRMKAKGKRASLM